MTLRRRERGAYDRVRSMRRLAPVLFLAVYAAALFGAPLAHEIASPAAHHEGPDHHLPALVRSDAPGAPGPDDLHLCSVCQWTAANRACLDAAPLLPAGHAFDAWIELRTEDAPASHTASLASARGPPRA